MGNIWIEQCFNHLSEESKFSNLYKRNNKVPELKLTPSRTTAGIILGLSLLIGVAVKLINLIPGSKNFGSVMYRFGEVCGDTVFGNTIREQFKKEDEHQRCHHN